MNILRSVPLLLAIATAGCQAANDRDERRAAADQERDADKAVTRMRLEKIGDGVTTGLPFMYYARSTGALGLSWRVGILPYIGEKALHDQFKLDEPWDSAHNKPLVEKMPEVFQLPRGNAPAGHTYYRAFLSRPLPMKPVRGIARTAFPPPMTAEQVKGRYSNLPPTSGNPLPMFPEKTVPDGTVNTFFFVEAGEAVPWTKPDELLYDAVDPLPKLGGVYDEGFFAMSVAGSVAFVPGSTDEKTIRAYITSSGNETIEDKGLLEQFNAPFPRNPVPPSKPGK